MNREYQHRFKLSKAAQCFASFVFSVLLVMGLCPPVAHAEPKADAEISTTATEVLAEPEAASLPAVETTAVVTPAADEEEPVASEVAATAADEVESPMQEAATPAAELAEVAEPLASEAAAPSEDAAALEVQDVAVSHVVVSVTGIRYNPDGSWTTDSWLAPTSYEFEADTATALDIFKDASMGCTFATSDGPYGESIDSITKNGLALGTVHDGPGEWDYSYWSFYVNDGYASEGAGTYKPADGETISLVYYKASGTQTSGPETEEGTQPDAVRPGDIVSEWSGFAGDARINNAITNAITPNSADTTKLAWSFNYLSEAIGADNGYTQVSEPLIVDGSVVVVKQSRTWSAVGSDEHATLYLIDAQTGVLNKQKELATNMDYSCRPLYAGGLIVVPLVNGRLQALTADTLATVWISEALPADPNNGSQQSVSSLVYGDGYVYAATTIADWSTSYGGTQYCVDMANGTIVWKNVNNSKGYYWTGAALAGDYLFYAGDDGVLTAANKNTGLIADRLSLGGQNAVRSSISAQVENKVATLFFSSSNGVLHKVTAILDGAFEDVLDGARSVAASFASMSTSSPTVCGGYAFVGGAAADGSGIFAVFDAVTMKKLYSISVPAQVQSTPLVSTGTDGQVYAYFTANTEPGGVYVYKLGDTSAQLLFTPTGAFANYCLASVIAGADGTLYYTNDSSNLFALRATAKPSQADTPQKDDTPQKVDPQQTTDTKGSAATSLRAANSRIDLSHGGSVKAQTLAKASTASSNALRPSAASTKSTNLLAQESAGDLASGIPWQYVGIALGLLGLVLAGFLLLLARKKGTQADEQK